LYRFNIKIDKKDYIPLSSLIPKISEYMKKNRIHTIEISFEDGILKLNVYSIDEKYITNFVNELVKKEHLNIQTNGVEKDKSSQNYTSIINIKVDL
jgi:hypothetical protein